MGADVSSFIFYSFLIYPLTNWLVQWPLQAHAKKTQIHAQAISSEPQEARDQAQRQEHLSRLKNEQSWLKIKGAIQGSLFLILVTSATLYWEAYTAPPSSVHNPGSPYLALGVHRGSALADIKKAYRMKSLYLHPDKNPSATAAEEFRYLTQSYYILTNGGLTTTDSNSSNSTTNDDIWKSAPLRVAYDKLGHRGVQMVVANAWSLQGAVFYIGMYYLSNFFYTYLFTFNTDTTGTILSFCYFGLAVMCYVELLLITGSDTLPPWLFPTTTPSDVVHVIRRFYPAYMHAVKSIVTSFAIDPFPKRKILLSQVRMAAAAITNNALIVSGIATGWIEVDIKQKQVEEKQEEEHVKKDDVTRLEEDEQ